MSDGDTFLIQVLQEGGTIVTGAPSAALNKRVLFGTYVQGNAEAVKGTVVFTGNFNVQSNGQFRFHEKVMVEFEDITVWSQYPLGWEPAKSEERYSITGNFIQKTNLQVYLDKLIVSKDLTIKDEDGGSTLMINHGMTVKRGATLSIEGSVYIDLRNEGTQNDSKRVLTVDGAIVESDEAASGGYLFLFNLFPDRTRGDGSKFIPISSYDPSDGVGHTDCVRITGSGEITVPTVYDAMGTVCVDLKRVGGINVAGSIQEGDGTRQAKNISTDLIFRNDVVVEGDIEQWGDSRIVFEKTSTIRGNVVLTDGRKPKPSLYNSYTGTPRSTSARKGVQDGNSGDYKCAYVTRRTDKKQRAAHIPGVQFEGAAMITGNLDAASNSLTETASHATQSSTACAPRVLFMAPVALEKGSEKIARVSEIKGNLSVRDDEDFSDKGRVYLDSDSLKTNNVMRRTAHSVRVGGIISAKGNTIGMAYPSKSSIDGMCTAKDTGLTFGNHIVFTGAMGRDILGQGTEIMLDALVALGDVDVKKGPLTVKTLHIGPRAELTATKDVKVTQSLILEGELSGELDEASTIKTLTYGSRNTDLVKKAALTDMLDALAIHVGSGELRLDEVHKTKNLGLCSGTLSLVDVESTTDSTLHVTDHITVQNGMLAKDTNDPGSVSTDKMAGPHENDRYVLTYITPGTRTVTDALEWFDPRDVIVNHAKAEITVNDDRLIIGKLTITKGKLTVDGMLTVGTSTLHRTDADATKVDNYSIVVAAGELHTEGQDVRVHGKVSVNGKSKLMTGGGDLHVLGRVQQGRYASNTAQASIEKDAMIHLGDGTLMLGPEDTQKRNNVKDNDRPDVLLTLTGSLTADMIKVPKGSKQTTIDASADSKMLQTVVFDGTMTPGTGNWDGTLYLKGATGDGKMLTVDSLSAMKGSVEITDGSKKAVITKDVALTSATIWPRAEMTEFMGDLMISGTGGLNADMNTDTKARSVLIHGDFTQRKGTTSGDLAGVKLDSTTTKTVMGMYVVDSDTVRYVAEAGSKLILHGGFHFAKKGDLNAMVEFTGKEEAQEVMTGDTTALHSVTVNNAKGLLLKSHVMQQKMATLTLRQGKIHSMPMDSMFMWTVQNVQVEQELRGRSTAQEGSKCGDKNNEACKATILRGSRQSYVGGPVVRHLLQGNAGAGFASGGYLFPVGMDHKTDQDTLTLSYYLPLILQLPSDLTETTAATVSPFMDSKDRSLNLTVPTAGGSLTLDAHADLFWKVTLTDKDNPDVKKELGTNANLRLATAGLRNVADASGLRIVQWDCMWKNPKLAGRRPAQADANSFGVNGYLNGVVNLTQEEIGLGSCAIFGIAANGIENPIDQSDLSGGRANLQFIHNVPLPTPINLHLGDIQIGSGMQFRSATAYRPVGAGSHDLKIQPAGAPAEQAITQMLSLAHNKNYVVIAHGSLSEPMLKVLETRMTSRVANQVEVLLVHGSADLGAARVDVMNPIDPMTVERTLAGNLMLDEATRYTSLNPSQQVFQVKSTDGEVTEFYEMNLFGYKNQTLVLNLSGMRNDLTILGVDRNGMMVPTMGVTGVEESAELPTEFALHGNYPNPFNPSTRIQFDLPENAQVQIQIVDMLGREVITLPAQEMEAGANRSVELHASSLASGTYLYRLIATGAEQRHVKTGRMTLVK